MHHFEISPNCSLSSRSALAFFALVGGSSLVVATGFALQGFWPVLPFAGLELAVLWFALSSSLKRGKDRDLIDIDAERVVVRQIRRGRITRREAFARAWTRARLRQPRNRHRLPLLEIGSGQRWLGIGEFLSASDRHGLKQRLAAILSH